jgi:uncharacterized membrane protein YsdA (DUF1294 family)
VILRYAAITTGLAILMALLIWWIFPLDGLLSWLIAINLVAFLTFGYDKSIAGSRHSRVPERVLLWLALILGSLGAWLGMQVFHHKTVKESFQRRFWLVVLVQIGMIILYYWIVR